MADVEAALLDFFDDMAYTTTVADFGQLPTWIADRGGALRIRRIGGGGDRDNDEPIVSIQAYASETQADPRAAHDLAQQVFDRFLEVLDGERSGWVSGVTLEDPSKTSGPVELPSPEPTISIVESIYRLRIRN